MSSPQVNGDMSAAQGSAFIQAFKTMRFLLKT
jgi:hypothetical protein